MFELEKYLTYLDGLTLTKSEKLELIKQVMLMSSLIIDTLFAKEVAKNEAKTV
ncbi:MAG: hypothetical protein WCQ47_04630 [bacterium]